MGNRSSFTSALLVLCLFATARVEAQDGTTAGNDRAARGQKLFTEGRYAEAIDELRAGYIATAQPRFLFALGQAYRMTHQCVEAVKAYREFLHANPARDQALDAEKRIQLCGSEDPSSVAPPPAITPPDQLREPTAAVTAAEMPNAQQVPPPKRPLYKRWWLWTTVGVVAAGVAVGLGVGLTRQGFNPTVPPFANNH